MLQIRFTPNLLTLGTAILLLGVSVGSNIVPAYAAADANYIAPENSPTVRPLGQIDTGTTTYQSQAPIQQAPQASADNTPALQPIQSGNITYITGGIGDEERSELQAVKGEYNLHVMSATRDGAFVGDTRITILDRNSGELVNTSAGPLFFAKLPDGNYTLQASRDGVTKEQKVTIHHGNTSHVHLSW